MGIIQKQTGNFLGIPIEKKLQGQQQKNRDGQTVVNRHNFFFILQERLAEAAREGQQNLTSLQLQAAGSFILWEQTV